MLFRLENNQKTQSFYMCTSELGAGREKNASYAACDRSCTRLGFRYRAPEPKKANLGRGPHTRAERRGSLTLLLNVPDALRSFTPRNV